MSVRETPAYIIRRAVEEESAALTQLAIRSKARWNYSPEFIAACRTELAVTPEMIAAGYFYVAEDEATQTHLGFYSLEINGASAELVHCFVAPEFIGQGVGKKLWQHAITLARELEVKELYIESDPHAEEFYKYCGARRIGEKPSQLFSGRTLPLMRYVIE